MLPGHTYLSTGSDWARGDKDKARQRFERATRLKRDYADAYLWWGRSLLALEQHPQAIVALEEAVGLSPSLAAAYDYLGTALLAEGENAKAIDAFQHATDLKLGDLDVAMHLAQALLAADRPDEAKQVLQTVAQLRKLRRRRINCSKRLNKLVTSRVGPVRVKRKLTELSSECIENRLSL